MISRLKDLNSIKYKLDLKTKICYFVLIFFIASIVGFIYEMIFYLVTEGIFEKRGFLYGLYVPVYGIGALLMIIFLKRFKRKPVLFFTLAMFVTGILEYLVGSLMVTLYDKMWWTYEGLFLNIGGHVCLRSVVSFAIGGLFLIYIVDPLVLKFCNLVDKKKLYILSCLIVFIFVFDFILTLIFRNPL